MRLVEDLSARFTQALPVKLMPSQLSHPIASFTFDDFPKSSWTVGGPILARYQVPATFYVAGTFCGRTVDGVEYYDEGDLRDVHAAGHEIGCHTFAHQRVTQADPRTLLEDAERNARFIRAVLGDVIPATFAYPRGGVSPRTKALFGRRFACCRGTGRGINRRFLHLGQLKVICLERDVWSAGAIEGWLAKTRRARGWIIFVTHDIDEAPRRYGITPGMLEQTLSRIRTAGIEALTVKNALARACLG